MIVGISTIGMAAQDQDVFDDAIKDRNLIRVKIDRVTKATWYAHSTAIQNRLGCRDEARLDSFFGNVVRDS